TPTELITCSFYRVISLWHLSRRTAPFSRPWRHPSTVRSSLRQSPLLKTSTLTRCIRTNRRRRPRGLNGISCWGCRPGGMSMVLTQFVFRFPCFRVSVFNSAFFHWLFEFSLLYFWVYSGAFLQVLIT